MSTHHCSTHGIIWHISSGGCQWCRDVAALAAKDAEIAGLRDELGAFRSSVTAMREQLDEFARRERDLQAYVDFLTVELDKSAVFMMVHGSVTPREVIEKGIDLRARIGRGENGEWTR